MLNPKRLNFLFFPPDLPKVKKEQVYLKMTGSVSHNCAPSNLISALSNANLRKQWDLYSYYAKNMPRDELEVSYRKNNRVFKLSYTYRYCEFADSTLSEK